MSSDTDSKDACLDGLGDLAGKFNAVFSQILIKYVGYGHRMKADILSLLKPDGIAFHKAMTLCAPPFGINKLLSERLAQLGALHLLLKTLFHN